MLYRTYQSRSLARRIADSGEPDRLSRHRGVIQSINTDGTVNLTLDGSTLTLSSIPRLTSVILDVGDTIEAIIDENDVFIIGKLADANSDMSATEGYVDQAIATVAKVVYARMEGGTTDALSGTSTTIQNFASVEGETTWCDPANGIITIGEDGIYSVNAAMRSATTSSDGPRWLLIAQRNNNTIFGGRIETSYTSTSSDPALTVSTGPLAMLAGDVIHATIYQNTGFARTVDFQLLSVLKH